MRYLLIIMLTISFGLLAVCKTFGQRYLPEQKGIQITTGTVNGLKFNNDFHIGAAYSFYTQQRNRWVFGGEYLEKRFEYKSFTIPQSQFTAEAGYYVNFLSDRSKTVFFSTGLSALAGYETINWDKKLLPDGATIENQDAFIYGGTLRFETEIFLTNRLVLLVNVRQRALFGTSMGHFNTQFGTGIKWIY